MKYKSVYSENKNISEAVGDVQDQLSDMSPKMVLYFSTSNHEPAGLSRAMNDAFPESECFGCTTSGEITTGKMLDNSLVVMAFSDEVIGDMHTVMINDIQNDEDAVTKAAGEMSKYFGKPLSELDYREYVGILLIDGLSGAEEKVIEKIGDVTNIKIVGGSAGDDLKFKQTHVFHNRKSATNAAVLCIMKPKVKFDVIKTQSFVSTENTLTVTKTNEEAREVIEFNSQPAANEYSKALQTTVDDLAAKAFRNPLGIMVTENEPFVRSPRMVQDGSVFFYCSVKEGMELNILSPTDIISDTAKAIGEQEKRMGGISAIINFHCILRTLELKEEKKTDAYGDIFKDIPSIGFSTYGECYLGHINQTSTMLVFGQ